MSILATSLRPDAGRGCVGGLDVVTEAAQVRRVIGLAGQFAAVDPNLTGRENLRLIGRLSRVGRRQARVRADELLDPPVAHFTPVTLANGVSLDFDHYDHVDEHHYAFQLSDEEFQAAFGRIRDRGITYYADPACRQPGQVYASKNGRRGTISGTRTVTSWKSSPL